MADVSFDSMIAEYLVYCHAKQLRKKTMNSYEQTLRLFQRWCFDELEITTVDAVSESVIRHYMQGKLMFNILCVQKPSHAVLHNASYRKRRKGQPQQFHRWYIQGECH